jgi:hypothetical protein
VPGGEVLKLSHWIAQMHLWCAEDSKPEVDDVELHDRMRKGLGMTAGADLLLLCAWAYAKRSEIDDAKFAYRQSKEREGSQRLDVSMPTLATWVAEFRKAHPDVDQPEVEPDAYSDLDPLKP